MYIRIGVGLTPHPKTAAGLVLKEMFRRLIRE